MKASISTRFRAWMLSTVGTRLVKPPSVTLTARAVPAAEAINVPTRHGQVRCLITRPAPDAPLAGGGVAPPVNVHMHGGAFIVGTALDDVHLGGGIAGEVGAVVVNVDYSTSPRARFPQALEECFDVLQWT